jgi:hypothetical protein
LTCVLTLVEISTDHLKIDKNFKFQLQYKPEDSPSTSAIKVRILLSLYKNLETQSLLAALIVFIKHVPESINHVGEIIPQIKEPDALLQTLMSDSRVKADALIIISKLDLSEHMLRRLGFHGCS